MAQLFVENLQKWWPQLVVIAGVIWWGSGVHARLEHHERRQDRLRTDVEVTRGKQEVAIEQLAKLVAAVTRNETRIEANKGSIEVMGEILRKELLGK